MWRWLFTFLCALSLLLWLATIVMWARSYRVNDGWAFAVRPATPPAGDTKRQWHELRHVVVSRGSAQYLASQYPQTVGQPRSSESGYRKMTGVVVPRATLAGITPPGQRQWWVPGIAFLSRPSWVGNIAVPSSNSNGRQFISLTAIAGTRSVIVSLWIPGIASGILPALWIYCWLRRRKLRRAAGRRCRVCLYDLTGNISGICPECGTAVEWGSMIAK